MCFSPYGEALINNGIIYLFMCIIVTGVDFSNVKFATYDLIIFHHLKLVAVNTHIWFGTKFMICLCAKFHMTCSSGSSY
jgi:hypothetical protein